MKIIPEKRRAHWCWVFEWLLFNTNSECVQLFHGENKLIINDVKMRVTLY